MSILDDIESLEERGGELELLLLEESLERDELAEEVELLKEQLKEAPKIIIKEIHHHYPQWNYYPPIQTQPFYTPISPITGPYCGDNNKYLC